MATFVHIQSADGRVLYSTLPKACVGCASMCKVFQEKTTCSKKSGESRRHGSMANSVVKVYLCSSEESMVRSSRIFKNQMEMYRTLGQVIENLKGELVKESNKDVTRIIHDLTSINGHSIQELYNLVPRSELVSTHREQVAVVKDYIARNLDASASVFLRMVRHNAAMKAVLNVSNKLHQENPVIRRKHHSVRNVLFSLLYSFLQDFNDREVTVRVGESDERLFFDYDSIHVVLYNLLENATKYVKGHTAIDIRINGHEDYVDIIFEMQSLKITDEDMGTFFDEGVRGYFANQMSIAGEGIGMSRAKAILDMHGGRLMVERNSAPSLRSQVDDIPFEANRFVVRLERISEADDHSMVKPAEMANS